VQGPPEGADNAGALAAWGFSADEVVKLTSAGAI
jgi:hypothetical protein